MDFGGLRSGFLLARVRVCVRVCVRVGARGLSLGRACACARLSLFGARLRRSAVWLMRNPLIIKGFVSLCVNCVNVYAGACHCNALILGRCVNCVNCGM